jgi:hypothetical protein
MGSAHRVVILGCAFVASGMAGTATAEPITVEPPAPAAWAASAPAAQSITVTGIRQKATATIQIHDPTTPNRQGNDRGPSYRSGLYTTSEAQRQTALDTIADVNACGLWPGKVCTEVKPAGDFWQAEPEHQDYLRHYPNGYTCHCVRPGWKLPQRPA